MPNIETIIEQLQQAVKAQEALHPVFDNVFVYKAQPDIISQNPAYTAGILHTEQLLPDEEKESLVPGFERDINCFSCLNPEMQRETAFYLLQKYGWRTGVPEKGELQDVAFCDARRIEYALENKEGGAYLLVKGDFSGIQGYIYGNLKPKVTGALGDLSKRLRGRSAIVSLLTEFLPKVILRELGLPAWHLLFAGGGHFNLLLPKAKEGELMVLSEKLDKEMRRWFGDRLNLILAWIDADETIGQKAGNFFKQVEEEKEKKKYQQHYKYLEDHFYPSEEEQNSFIYEVEVGEQFPKRNLLAMVVSESGIPPKNYAMPIFDFEMHAHHYQLFLIKREEINDALDAAENLLLPVRDEIAFAQLLFINTTDFLPDTGNWDYQKNKNVSFGFVFMGRNIPFNEATGQPKDFEELCFHQNEDGTLTPAEMKKGFLRLGALRLDVDDLGYIFSNGIRDASLGQLACLSREMHYFFTAHFDRRAKELDIYVIYSGGDDAFVVGRWDKVIKFVKTIEKDFKDFVQNKEIHFSAGIFMGDPKYPVGRFYRDAGRLQKDAKESRYIKNTVNAFDQNMGWKEFDSKISLGDGFAKILMKEQAQSKRKFTRSFANRVLRLVKSSFHERNGYDEAGQPVKRGFMDVERFSKNITSMRYLFARHGYTHDELVKVTDEIEKQLTIDFLKSFDHDAIGKKTKAEQIRNYLVAFNYALYTIRSKEKSLTS